MTALKAILLCVAAAMMAAVIRRQQPQMAMALTMAAGAAVLALLSEELTAAVRAMLRFTGMAGMDSASARTLLRASVIALAAEFAAQLCEDAGEKAMASRVALAARVAMLVLTAPVLSDLLELVSDALL